jgi:hypothetical protein
MSRSPNRAAAGNPLARFGRDLVKGWRHVLIVVVGVVAMFIGSDRILTETDNINLTYAWIGMVAVVTGGVAGYVKRRTDRHGD